jgi:outer membrane protein
MCVRGWDGWFRIRTAGRQQKPLSEGRGSVSYTTYGGGFLVPKLLPIHPVKRANFSHRRYARWGWLLAFLAAGPAALAQSEVSVQEPQLPPVVGHFLRPFHIEKRIISPARLTNSPRLQQLVRAGNLYLSAQDVIALVLENNLDIAVQRYAPLLSRELQRRADAGQYLRDVSTPILSGPTSVSTAGVSGNANGLVGGSGFNAGGSVITQVGSGLPNLDPYITAVFQIGHYSTPESNAVLNATDALVTSNRYFYTSYNQSFITGTTMQADFTETRLLYENGALPLLENPVLSGILDFNVTQPLLQGLSFAVNKRDILVARNTSKVNDLQVKLQVATTVAAVLNLYYDLVSFNDAVRTKEQALAAAEQLYEGNQKEADIGAMGRIEVTRAAAGVSSAKEDLLIAQTNVQQQEIVLKNALSRNVTENTWLDEVHIVPLDQIEIPKTEDVRPVQDLVQEALANRVEIQQAKINLDSQKIMTKGTKDALKPSLSAFADVNNAGLAGPLNPIYNNCCGAPAGLFVGNTGTVLSQIFDRKFPNYSAGLSFNIPFRNRVAQADYVTDELQLRQRELQTQRAINQVRVDVKTAVIGLQQARARYETAVETRKLAEQSLDAEQKRFQYGVSTVALVIQAQKDLAADQDAEVQAMANYSHARIFFDSAMGRTLEVNHISMKEALDGRVARESVLPANLPPAQAVETSR